MGIQINGQNDTVSASDGSINITGEITSTVLNQTVTGVVTFTDAEFSTGFNVTGVVTATSFSGDGTNLTGIDASSLKSGGVVKVQANSSGAVVTGVVTTGNAFIKDSAVGLGTTSSTGRDAGIGTATGTLIYLPASGLQIYTGDDGGWKTVADTNEIGALTVTGGTVTTSGNNRIHTFTSDGTFTTDGEITSAQLLVIAGGGGGGGNDYGAGGGAGGVAYSAGVTIPAASYTATVGPGGAAGASGAKGTTGTDSTFGSAFTPAYRIAKGGGGSGLYVTGPSGYGQDGGSGGGASARPGLNGGTATQPTQNPGVTVTNSGNAGGSYTQGGSGYAPCGGGGAGGVGGSTPGPGQGGRPGGVGIEYSISGTPVYYAGGGGASIYASQTGPAGNGSGGNGGGGNGGNANNGLNGSSPGINGVDGKGGGGGGAHSGASGHQNSTTTGGAGGKGVIIVSYPTVDNNIA